MQYVFARYLADMGHEVTLFMVNEYEHFLPEKDSEIIDDRITYSTLSFSKEEFGASRYILEWKEKLHGFDLFSCSEFGPAILAVLGIKPWVYIPIGTDFTHYPFFKLKVV